MLFNWIVNPYDIYNSVQFEQVKNKPLVATHLRLAKAMAVGWNKPQYLIMGSSTAETGLNPEHPAWANNQVYNLGLGGANIYEVMRYLQHAQAVRPVKKVVLVINFFMFNAYLKNRVDFDESLLKVNADGIKNSLVVNNVFSTILSYDAIKASIETIKNQDKQNAYKSNGQLILDYRTQLITQLKGYKNNFEHVESYNKQTFLPAPVNQYDFVNAKNKVNTLNYFRQIIRICEQNNTELTIILAPEHARLLETYKLLGLYDKYEQWQIEVARLIQQHNLKSPSRSYILWAFNKVNTITTEQLPDTNDPASKMHWFWDPFHFKSDLGDLVLSRVLDPLFKTNIINFSSRLSDKKINLRKELKRNKQDLEQWELVNKTQVKELSDHLL